MAKPRLPQFVSLKLLLAILVILVLAFVAYSMYGKQGIAPTTTTTSTTAEDTTTTTTTTTTTLPSTIATLAMDLHADGTSIQGGSVVHEIEFTITGIEVYKDGEWIVLSDEASSVNLIKDTDTVSILEADAEQGTYEKIKLKMSGGDIWITNDLFYIYTPKRYDLVTVDEAEIEHGFELASEPLKLTLDLDVRNSITRLGVEYLLDPVITVTE